MPDSTQGPGRGTLRRIPKQERSRERIDEILKVSMELIGRKGIDAVTMKEIAALSGGPIASVYQYFPNKSAIIAMLYEKYAEEVLGFVNECVADLQTEQDAFGAIDKLIDLYYANVRNNPPVQDLINAIQADKALADMDIAESRVHSRIFADATGAFVPDNLRERYVRLVFMMFHLAASAVRLALLVPEQEAEGIIENFKASAKIQLGQFMKGNYPSF
ncbi:MULTISPECIES: TetR/AcrR family transcriptional regulator [Neorhizobium]|jgi:AcrR family transcriptional regulator|uniref:TetR/AcrR family transcriptional regulator n=1 Tax=Neorhizobium TaxID=1525371 RepID=UPI000CF960CE|nr:MULTISPECIES: TetR/AcrR family transcriptional regulator [Neorhizobium]